MPRAWVWLQLLIGWLPIWALFALLVMTAHGIAPGEAALVALRMIVPAALLGLVVYRWTARLPWPHPFQLRFLAAQALAAAFYSLSWFLLNCTIESLVRGQMVVVIGPGLGPYLITGIWLYLMVAGVAYGNRAAERAAQMSAQEARMQLAALRAQLHPHFLFNALHTVVQLIPIDPRGAARAAEQLAAILRTAIEEQRDLLPLADEWTFVQRYLEIEGIRFGDRLQLHVHIDDAARDCLLPSFALQTLVENAVRHAAAPRVDTTVLTISAQRHDHALLLTVADNGSTVDMDQIAHSQGTGLRRLRERLLWLYGSRASLELEGAVGGGLLARMLLPQISQTPAAESDRER